jgi:O-methyltransferase
MTVPRIVNRALKPLGLQLASLPERMFGQPLRFHEDGLCTIHNCDFTASPRFLAAYAAGEATQSWKGWQLRWRAHVLCWAAEHATKLSGDFVECGVNRGGNARMIIEYIGGVPFTGRRFYLLDTFKGFAEQYLSEGEKQSLARIYAYPDCLEEVRRTFAPFPFAKVLPGPVPDTLAQVQSQSVAFLSIDMNCAAPEIAAAEFFWPKLCPGAIVVLDDYGFEAHVEQKLAFDRFAEQKSVPLLSLPTGQGLLIKP